MIPLLEVAHCRAGDKGGDSLLAVIAHRPVQLQWLVEQLTREALAAHFRTSPKQVGVVVAPQLGALVVTLRGFLNGGVTRSVGIDPHGKSLSGHLLTMELPDPTPGADR